jgi:hypothetical protein
MGNVVTCLSLANMLRSVLSHGKTMPSSPLKLVCACYERVLLWVFDLLPVVLIAARIIRSFQLLLMVLLCKCVFCLIIVITILIHITHFTGFAGPLIYWAYTGQTWVTGSIFDPVMLLGLMAVSA